MQILTIIGNRPQFVKLAAVSPKLRERHHEVLVHTGQHHDHELSRIFFDELELPEPDVQLKVAGGSNSSQTSRMLGALEPLLREHDPDLILVYGDTNSTLAGSLLAAQSGVPLAHVEAGLRSFDRTMPEEVNRVVCDALASLLLAPGQGAADNLACEGAIGEVVVTGDVMGDVVLGLRDGIDRETICQKYDVEAGEFLFLTAHRAGNVDDPLRLAALVELIRSLDGPVLFAVHPRTRTRLDEQNLLSRLEGAPGINLLPPLGYGDTIALAATSRAVLTDSGGLQKEALWLGTQCLTLRPTTEWTETVDSGWNTLVDLDRDRVAAVLAAGPPQSRPPMLYGAGSAGRAVVDAIESCDATTRDARVESAS